MKKCIDCGTDISHKTSNNVKRCTQCSRLKWVDRDKVKRHNKGLYDKKSRLLALYRNSCAICGWRVSDDVCINNKTISLTYGCEIHHIIPVKESKKNSQISIDSLDNLILLCPNHHKMSNLGIISKDDLMKFHKSESEISDVEYAASEWKHNNNKRLQNMFLYNEFLK